MNKKIILITGASKGIGRQLALEYSKEPCKFILLARDEIKLETLSEYLNLTGSESYFMRCDVADKSDVERAIDFTVNKFGGIDIAILNAGVSIRNNFKNFKPEILESVIKTNLFGIAYFFEKLIPIMRKQGRGTIVGVSSLADSRAYPGNSSYAASKIAVSYLLEAARAELNQFNIDVINVRPGFVDTEMVKKNNYYMPFFMSVENAGRIIKNGIDKNKHNINFPLPMVIITTIIKVMPKTLFLFLSQIFLKSKINE